MRDGLPRWLIVSASVHVAVGFVIAEQRAALRSPRSTLEPLQLEFVLVRPDPSSSTVPRDPASLSPPAPIPPRSRPFVRARAPTALTFGADAQRLRASEQTRAAADPSVLGDDRTSFTLSPRAAALSTLETPNASPEEPSAEQKLERAITEGAKRSVDRAPDPVLIPRAEGGYSYKGHGFDATIAPNGDLTMRDRYGSVVLPFVPFQTATGEWRIALLGGTFRLYEWLDRKFGKNDPYASERRWFLARTRELRESLARKYAPHFDKPSSDP